MGTNYFIHLGKRSAIGDGKCSFTVALPKNAFRNFPAGTIVRDEYGVESLYETFAHLIGEDIVITDSIGTEFC